MKTLTGVLHRLYSVHYRVVIVTSMTTRLNFNPPQIPMCENILMYRFS